MAQASTLQHVRKSTVSLNGSRLIRLLSELAAPDIDPTHDHFSEKLGQLIDMADSIKLSDVHSKIRRLKFEPSGKSSSSLTEEFLRVRSAMVHAVMQSFSPQPKPMGVHLPEPSSEFEPYHRFYAAHQRAFEFKIQQQQVQVRDAVKGLSIELAKLAALDETMGETLLPKTRKFFSITPKLLQRRFESLLDSHKQWVAENEPEEDGPILWLSRGRWLDVFYRDMQGVLLAELEARLLPILGLLEAVNEQGE